MCAFLSAGGETFGQGGGTTGQVACEGGEEARQKGGQGASAGQRWQ